MKKEEYLDILTEQIRYKRVRGAVREELAAHMEDQKEAFMEDGMEPEEAEERAVKEMGDPVEAGISMDRIHRPKMAWGSILFICFLSLGGLLIQYLLQKQFPDIIFLPGSFVHHLIYVIVGLGVMMLFCFVDYSRIGYRAREISIVLFILLFVAIGMFGKQINGAKAWISLGGITLDVKMAVFLFIPLYSAAYQKLRLKSIIGLGYGSQYISEDGSGYILHYIAVYYGMIAAIMVVGCIAFLFLYFLKLSFRQKNQLGQLMGAGCSVVFVIQTGIYILSNMGILPGIVNCPFITYGGTGIFVTYILLGILLSIYRYQNIASERHGISRLFAVDKV